MYFSVLALVTAVFCHGAVATSGAAAASCSNAGMQWALYNNTAGYNPGGSNYSAFDPTVYKSATPKYTGTTKQIGGNFSTGAADLVGFYGSPQEFNSTYYVLNHRAYIHVKNSGKYTFSLSGVDDILLVWTGQNAASGWTRANANCVAINVERTPGTCQFTTTLTKGQYVPIRVMYGQSLYTASFTLKVSNPSGLQIVDQAHISKNIIQFGCGKALSKAPHYPPFGQE